MSFAKASLWTASSTLTKIVCGLLIIKLLAISYGPQGIGLASNYRQLITVLSVMAGAGIFNGVTRFVAEYRDSPAQLHRLCGTASALVAIASLVLAALFIIFASAISQALFDRRDYSDVIRWLALLQAGIGWANLLQAKLKGFKDARGNALVVIAGCLIALPSYLVCWQLGGYTGALVGIALVPAVTLVPAYFVLIRRTPLRLSDFMFSWDRVVALKLLKYTLMTAITAVTLPVAWVIMRHQLAAQSDWQAVGLWQSVVSVSDAYLQFITATFSVWLLPSLSRLNDKRAIAGEITRTLKRVLPAVALLSLGIWLLRDLVIWLLFSDQFYGMRDLFAWQLPGDVCKVGAYIFGYLVIAKGSLRLYILTEITQFALLLLTSHWLIAEAGVLGAVQAYCLTYSCYFLLVIAAFMIWYRK